MLSAIVVCVCVQYCITGVVIGMVINIRGLAVDKIVYTPLSKFPTVIKVIPSLNNPSCQAGHVNRSCHKSIYQSPAVQ